MLATTKEEGWAFREQVVNDKVDDTERNHHQYEIPVADKKLAKLS